MTTQQEQDLERANGQALQHRTALAEQLTTVQDLPPDDRGDALDDLLAATTEFLAAEANATAADQRLRHATLKKKAAEAQRPARLHGAVPMLVGVVLAALILFTVIGIAWWLLSAPLMILGATTAFRPIAPNNDAITERRLVGEIAIVAAICAGIAAIPWPWSALTTVLVVLAGIATAVAAVGTLLEGNMTSGKAVQR